MTLASFVGAAQAINFLLLCTSISGTIGLDYHSLLPMHQSKDNRGFMVPQCIGLVSTSTYILEYLDLLVLRLTDCLIMDTDRDVRQ